MKELRMIVPFTYESLFNDKHRGLLEGVGSQLEWMVMWVLHQWPLMRDQGSTLVYDRLYSEMEEHLHGFESEEEGHEQFTTHYLEEHIDDFAEAAQEVYTQLAPFIGQIPHEQSLNDVWTDPFGKRDMVLTFRFGA